MIHTCGYEVDGGNNDDTLCHIEWKSEAIVGDFVNFSVEVLEAGAYSGRGFGGQNPYPLNFCFHYKNISKPLPRNISGYAQALRNKKELGEEFRKKLRIII